MEVKSRSEFQWKRLAGGVLLGALAAGMFIAGQRTGPQTPRGHDLRHLSLANRPPGSPVTSSPVTLASSHRATIQGGTIQVADNSLQGTGGYDPTQDDQTPSGPAGVFQNIYLQLKRYFVDGVPSDSKLGHGAAAAMLASLNDPASRFVEADEMTEMTNEAKGQFQGIGARLSIGKLAHAKAAGIENSDYTELRLTVISAYPGSPAEKAGLKSGDVITDIGSQWIATYDLGAAQVKELKDAQDRNDPVGLNTIIKAITKKAETALTLPQAEAKLDSPSLKPLMLTVVRAGEPKPLVLTIDTSAGTTITPITGKMLPGNIGYIKITEFAKDADQAFSAALNGFGPDIKGLVLDLRQSPGGLLDTTAAIASQLTTATTLGYVQAKGGKEKSLALTPARKLSCPIAVLVDNGTAGASELLAAMLESQGSKLVGTATFGDSADVELIPLQDGSGFTMTVGKWLTASHQDFTGVGLKPEIPITPASVDTDEALTRAVSELSGRMARLPALHG